MDGFQLPAIADEPAGVASPGEDDGVLELLREFLDEAEASLVGIEPAVLRLEQCPGDLAALSEAFRVMHTFKGTGGFLGLTRLAGLAHATEEVLDGLRRDATAGVAARPDAIGPILVAFDRLHLLLRQSRARGREPAGDDVDVFAVLRPATAATTMVAIPEPAPAETHAEPQVEGHAIRVAVPVLERLLASVGELVLARNQLLYHAERIADAAHDGDATLGLLAQRIGGITTELQAAVLRTRMQPIGQAWATLPRLVRDLSHTLGKRIALETTGTDVELDRQVLELLRDPLSHMVRNSCDHGIEPPDARAEAGKPATGRITLDARPDGASVVVTLRDDGRGIDPGRLRARARADGVLTEAEAAALSDAQALMLAFRPGVSTAATVTAVSGRGVGMDVVKTNIERIGGSVALASVPGRGTTLTLTLPLTLAIMPALMVATHGQRFALPRGAVGEIVRAPLDAAAVEHGGSGQGGAGIAVLDGVALLRLRDELVPLVDLGAVLGIAPAASGDALHVVVVRTGTVVYGLVVDPVFDTEEIVVTPLCAVLRGVAAFGGTTILGDGGLALVLDMAGLARLAGIDPATVRQPAARRAPLANDASAAISMLLFTASGQKMAVPLTLIARLEEVEGSAFAPLGDTQPGGYTLRLGDRLLTARDLRGRQPEPMETVATLIVGDGHRRAGLMIDRFEDVVIEPLRVEDVGVRPGVLGTALLAGHARAVLDLRHWLTRIDPAWFDDAGPAPTASRLLVVEDSDFFRNLLVPSLAAAGYAVTSTPSAAEALRLRDDGVVFDAVVTDVEMPGMGGLALVAAIRAGGAWAQTPVIALSARTAPADVAAGRAAGFTDHIRKFERAALLAALDRCLRPDTAATLAAAA